MTSKSTSTRELNEAYWSRHSAPPLSDALTSRRRDLVWRRAAPRAKNIGLVPDARSTACALPLDYLLVKRGFLDGRQGLVYSQLLASYEVLINPKLCEQRLARKRQGNAP